MIKTNIKMKVTPEQSRKVQEICFENGIVWKGELNNNLLFLERPYIFILKHLETANKSYDFENDELEEIDADLFIRTNGTCEESYTSKYGGTLPKDYNSALKKIENLHIALNKKVAKNKNQKEQINLLLKQKENYKQLQYDHESLRLQSNKKMKDVQNDFMNIVDDLNKTIDLLEDRIKEKETIIKYLESKLK